MKLLSLLVCASLDATIQVLYRPNGDLRRVKLASSTDRRQLADLVEVKGTVDTHHDTVDTHHDTVEKRRRRLYECGDCVETWDAVCSGGVPAVRDSLEYGFPISALAGASIETFCDTPLGARARL